MRTEEEDIDFELECIAAKAGLRVDIPRKHRHTQAQLQTLSEILEANSLKQERLRQARVYFLLNRHSNLLKIGFSQDVERRVKDLQFASGQDLVLLRTEPGARSEEKSLHIRFQHLRVKGEWFSYDGELKAYLEVAA